MRIYTAQPTRSRSDWRSPPLLGLLFATEASAFFVHIARDVAPFYPPAIDQTAYLVHAYKLVTAVRAEGVGRLLDPLLGPFQPNGFLFPILGAVGSMFIGSPRAGALAINLIAFVALQFGAFFTFRRIAGRDIAWLAVALILTLSSPFMWAGGIYDFRIDFYALCFFGLWCLSVILSDVFLSTKWSALSAALGIGLAYARFITIVYLLSILALLFVITLSRTLLASRDSLRRVCEFRRTRNILISGVLLFSGVAPFLWINRILIYNYYFRSMFVTSEKEIRASELGLVSLFDHLQYYPKSLLRDHLGAPLLTAMAVAPFIALGWAIAVRGRQFRVIWTDLRRWSMQLGFLCISIVVPLVMLNLSLSKSPVIGGVLSIPAICLDLVLIAAILGLPETSEPDPQSPRVSSAVRPGVRMPRRWLVLPVVAGASVFLVRASAATLGWPVHDREALNALYDQILTYETAAGTRDPLFSADRVADWLWASDVSIRSYERFNDMIDFQPGLGNSIWGVERDEALKILASSDVIVLTEPKGGRQLAYPMDAKIESYWQDLWDWSVANRLQLATETFHGMPHTVFVKPIVRISGASGPWITSDGITLNLHTQDLNRWPFIVLEGAALYDALGGVPRASATVVDFPSGQLTGPAVAAEFTRSGDTYRISIDARPLRNENTAEINILLTFDRFFVPSKLGINADTRELVVMEPTRHELRNEPQ